MFRGLTFLGHSVYRKIKQYSDALNRTREQVNLFGKRIAAVSDKTRRSVDREFQTTAQEDTAKSLAPRTGRVCRLFDIEIASGS